MQILRTPTLILYKHKLSIGSKTIEFPLRFLPPILITTNLYRWNQYSNFKYETKLKNVAKVTNY